MSVAFVLGGGGHLGAAEVGMLRALLQRDVRPDLIVGTSVGALHGAMVARNPSVASVEQLEATWEELAALGVLGSSWFTDATILLPTRTCACGRPAAPGRTGKAEPRGGDPDHGRSGVGDHRARADPRRRWPLAADGS